MYVGDNHTMPLEEADKKVSETTESDVQALRLRQAQIMLNLFQEDCGRPATALEEVKQCNFGFIADRRASPTLAQCKRDLLPIATLLHMRGIACGERTI